jgi:uncharacterized protein (TIGR02118 family)
MITRLGMAPRLEGRTYEEFQHHWRTSHADAAGKIPNLRRYVQNHAVLRDGVPVLGFPGFDACSELDFDSVESMNEGFGSEEYQVRVRADERAFVEKVRFSSILGNRPVLIDGARPKNSVKLLQFHRLHPRSTAATLAEVLHSFDASALQKEGVRRRELLVPLANPPADLGAPAAEAVDMQWFDGVDAALAYLRSGFADACAWKLAGVSFGGARHLATEVDVV